MCWNFIILSSSVCLQPRVTDIYSKSKLRLELFYPKLRLRINGSFYGQIVKGNNCFTRGNWNNSMIFVCVNMSDVLCGLKWSFIYFCWITMVSFKLKLKLNNAMTFWAGLSTFIFQSHALLLYTKVLYIATHHLLYQVSINCHQLNSRIRCEHSWFSVIFCCTLACHRNRVSLENIAEPV